jgi:hypothetical protein
MEGDREIDKGDAHNEVRFLLMLRERERRLYYDDPISLFSKYKRWMDLHTRVR